jgi:cell division protein FtsL
MTKRGFLLVAALGLGVLASGLTVVYSKYLTRVQFTRLQALTEERQRQEEEWALLRLEEASLSTHPRVEEEARRQLGMYLPRGVDVRTLVGGGDDR